MKLERKDFMVDVYYHAIPRPKSYSVRVLHIPSGEIAKATHGSQTKAVKIAIAEIEKKLNSEN